MGTGIAAAIPLSFSPDGYFGIKHEYFTRGFFDNFDVTEENGKKLYTIKQNILINNYKTFFTDFTRLIEEHIDGEIPDANSLEEFMDVFSHDARNGSNPFIYGYGAFSTLGCKCYKYWHFYSGSYKAYLEVYSTLQHLERIVAKTIKNPLANAVKFGIFG